MVVVRNFAVGNYVLAIMPPDTAQKEWRFELVDVRRPIWMQEVTRLTLPGDASFPTVMVEVDGKLKSKIASTTVDGRYEALADLIKTIGKHLWPEPDNSDR